MQSGTFLCLLALIALPASIVALDNGLAPLPMMGWNTWCTDDYCGLFDYCYDKEIREMADAFVSEGLLEAGYNYIMLDDCWGGPRDANGELTADPKRFPNGMQPVIDYVHSKGINFGLYLCAGNLTCKYKRPGSWGYFDQDASTMAKWNVDFVKMDWCYHPSLSQKEVYGMFSESLNKTGKAIYFNLCGWGKEEVWEWAMPIGNSWRVHPDHLPIWWTKSGTGDIIERMAGLSPFAAPGGWNDPDFLMTGLFPFTHEESKTEFSLWALWAAPLVVATDVRGMSDWKKSVLLNYDVIAVNQDELAIAGDRVYNDTDGRQVWIKPLANGDFAVVFYNSDNLLPRKVSASFDEIFNVKINPRQPAANWPKNGGGRMKDLWAHKELGVATSYETWLLPHHCAMLRVTPAY